MGRVGGQRATRAHYPEGKRDGMILGTQQGGPGRGKDGKSGEVNQWHPQLNYDRSSTMVLW